MASTPIVPDRDRPDQDLPDERPGRPERPVRPDDDDPVPAHPIADPPRDEPTRRA